MQLSDPDACAVTLLQRDLDGNACYVLLLTDIILQLPGQESQRLLLIAHHCHACKLNQISAPLADLSCTPQQPRPS